jgi:hypothetical protein
MLLTSSIAMLFVELGCSLHLDLEQDTAESLSCERRKAFKGEEPVSFWQNLSRKPQQ